ncbi:hypothetical protein CONCODRAFT_8170 [Conidiobolus coronatus NRRL 28638]|uniref:Uncharacterized protein n=1 Tax=Conidiobolus coronatus (strain ATCC 28846 / CBS 209.66 / NRRL 28638) TaxID=796925 RepID=A0A137P348_CONC2|nr:hypothetical protein CONCODRAFT_8170 [Conidiobolus coronatus NRRL 28638]|eukprot:KXN69432.1 hypothetical protein CONCODRAFT_8170 [Conidiobolus coronatus NRRL 28638]
MAIIHSSKLGFFLHILVLTLIFVLILTNTFIAVKEWDRWRSGGLDTVIVLGSLSLILLFVYEMYIGTTYSVVKRREDDCIPEAHKPVFNLTGYNSKGYNHVSSTYSDEEARETA